jgi:signal transduction histidine kinase
VGDHGTVRRRRRFDIGKWSGTATTVAAVFLVVAVAAIATLHWLNRHAGVGTWWMGSVAIGVGLGGVGVVLARRLPSNPIGWLMVGAAVAQSTLGLGREWLVYGGVTRPGSLPGIEWAGWLGTWPYAVSMAALPLVLIVFPGGHLPSRRWRSVVWVVASATAIGCVAQALMAGPFTEELPAFRNPIGIDLPFLVPVSILSQSVVMVALLAAIVSLVGRLRGASGELRQQLKWICFSGALLGLEVALELAPVPYHLDFLEYVGPVLLAFFLASITMAVLRYRLWDIDTLISVSLVYGSLTLVLGGTYVAVVAATGRLRDHPIAIGPSLLAAAAVALVFAPLRDLLQRRLDRWLYADRSDPFRALSRLGDRLGGTAPDDPVLDEVVEAIAASLRLDGVAIVVPDEGTLAMTGTLRPGATDVSLGFRSSTVGVLVVSPRPSAPIGPRERSVLDTLAPPVAAVVHAVATSQALQRSRRALVTAREEERRRIRRDLHDGLGPALAAVQMKLDGARLLLDRDPDRARRVIDQLTAEIRTTISDIRRLVHDLQPPALAEIGLVPAVAEQADAFCGPVDGAGRLDVELDAPPRIGGLPAAVEVAAYRIVCESLTNVVRHAAAERCRITLSVDDRGSLAVLVDDDGSGVGDEDRPGLGLRSMAERAAELGGTCRLEPSPLGGTRVAARFPLARPGDGGGRATPPPTGRDGG